MPNKTLSCMFCGKKACETGKTEEYPSFCVTTDLSPELLEKTIEIYNEPGIDRMLAIASAEVEGEHYGKACRAEEIIHFLKKIGAKKVGIASCIGLLKEAQTFCKLLDVNGFEYYGAACKTGATDKSTIGLPQEKKVCPGHYEPLCNPILQAEILNREDTDFNVVIGLCVGHDSLFYRYSKAPVTTFITKDRVLGHNPAAAIYQANAYYETLFKEPLK